jgi:hypothetical protein
MHLVEIPHLMSDLQPVTPGYTLQVESPLKSPHPGEEFRGDSDLPGEPPFAASNAHAQLARKLLDTGCDIRLKNTFSSDHRRRQGTCIRGESQQGFSYHSDPVTKGCALREFEPEFGDP